MLDDPRLDLSPAALERYLSGVELTQAVPESIDDDPKGLHKAWWAAIIAANLLDGLTTNGAIARGGREANPVFLGLSDNPMGMLAAKGGSGALIAALLHLAHKREPLGAKIGAGIATAIPTAAALHNSRVNR